jgi:hypothetical protein
MSSLAETPDLDSAGSLPAATAASCEEPATVADSVDDHSSETPLPMVDPSELDVPDWEVASPDL